MTTGTRLQTGNAELDALLGGGLLPGTLTVVAGATGIGKTQLGLHWAQTGQRQEGERGVVFDLTARGDSQNHEAYAQRLADWTLSPLSASERIEPATVWDVSRPRSDYVHIFEHSGRKVTRGDLEHEDWQEWKVELAKKLDLAIYFFYDNFIRGVRRVVIDGVEPTVKASDSFQFHLFDYIYHQILHKESDWVARDLFRVQFRANAERVAEHPYDHRQIGCLLLYTTHEVMLDDMLGRPIESGDALANANTIILMGKICNGTRMGRALHVAKHRGSACDDAIVPFEITESGLRLMPE